MKLSAKAVERIGYSTLSRKTSNSDALQPTLSKTKLRISSYRGTSEVRIGPVAGPMKTGASVRGIGWLWPS